MLPWRRGASCNYGSLSHSHLHQVLKNVKAAGPSSHPEVSHDGKFSLTKLRTLDPDFARAVDVGLCWEMLVSNIETEEPDGCATIQSAMNAKNGSFMVRHEMQALAVLVDYTFRTAVAGSTMSVESAKTKMKATLPEFASDSCFLDLYR